MPKSPKDTHGPIVDTGPTRGKNRSRNQDGTWRKKRSDAGKSKDKDKKGSGCFITTAVCEYRGLPDNCRELEALRHFRDHYLLGNAEGRQLVANYYRIAPLIVERLTDKADLDAAWRSIVACVELVEANKPNEAIKVYEDMVKDLI